mmetsp:Transcript_7446/g.16252  ORF Transcript_7446/g.16252 Transcript_7446/m.16252 type:complete len:615 (+) Transcript_7446:79-1923(+)
MVSGLASSIRSATESATFDLAGQDASSIRSTVTDAFSEPLTLATMIRITFVVGGGKLSRSKYDDKAMQAVTSVLKQLEYTEDRGASCVLECAGCFKTQHDTGKNVFTVVVFPRVAGASDASGGGKGRADEEDDEPLLPTNSPGYKMAVSSKQTFENLLSTYCPTYFEKRECLACLEGLLQVEQAIEQKLMKGHPLDSAEQSFYDDSSDLREKYSFAQKEAAKHVEEGRLTLAEKAALVEMNEKRIETLMNEKSTASVAEKLKKALARKQQLSSLTSEVLSVASSTYPPPLRYESQLNTLRKKLLPLQALEEKSKGRLLTLGETRSLTEKGELEEEIERLEIASCGWFEEEEAFHERLQKSRERFDSKHSRAKRGGGGGGGTTGMRSAAGKGNAGAVNKWILPGEKPKSAWGSSSTGKGKLKGKGGAVFSAMMMDSSSDEEEEESDAESEDDFVAVPSKKQHPAAFNVIATKKAVASLVKKSDNPLPDNDSCNTNEKNAAKEETNKTSKPADNAEGKPQTKKSKKKKKNKKKSKQQHTTDDQDEIPGDGDRAIIESNKDAPSTDETPSSVSDSLLQFWRSLLLPLIMFILDLFVSLVTNMLGGKKSKKGGKKKRG